ncbi:hypothetical protein [Novosphingobium aquae]|uniref:Uncharacterized protein n=1 Tax=Novosphingobium aquae TaxID=3133435 RepID=A0ABU8SBT4_9SPHN
MSISTVDGYFAAAKQNIPLTKTASRTSVALIPFSTFDLAGNPGAGTLAGSSTAAGIVPTDATAGCPVINAFGGGATGYLTRVDYANTVLSRLAIYDMLFKAGAYAFNAATTLASQPSFLGRCPDGAGNGNEIWIEAVTAFTGNLSIAVTYTNQAGTTGRTTGTVATGAALTVGRMVQLPLQAGDSGVQKIESVTGTVATVGTFNVLVLRPLWNQRITVANGGGIDDWFKTGAPIVYADSAIIAVPQADSTSTGLPDIIIEIANA